MITVSDDGTTATVVFPWPTNDTGGKTLRVMGDAALSTLQQAGYSITARPTFQDLRPAGGSWEFLFTVPATPPADPEGVTP